MTDGGRKEVPDEENFLNGPQNNLQLQYDPLLIFLEKQKNIGGRLVSTWIISLNQEGTI